MIFCISARPDAPTGLSPDDIDATSVALTWQKPKNDGGKKIQGYIVEYKEPTSNRWKQANAAPVQGTNFKVDDLEKGQEYEFRVRAKNEAGLSEPSHATGPILTRPKYCKLQIYNTACLYHGFSFDNRDIYINLYTQLLSIYEEISLFS